ncbi:putative ssDNA-binding protein [Cavenderia fasciculata]|uniref:SsDNA-binding protein n=1 Tax=Cavenderia fasciculata TaxID=261658 RepID=F4QFN5_CACFS|nr:putative ssDNA-binding protein [Cavenderia fasciculata]EGG13488.1 putative ssDNA-binding protein [Cavenderia fasciculata]|eukprot:XP_004350192.1 putative ssDNA-binding protein [Cavenderia fasciculata]
MDVSLNQQSNNSKKIIGPSQKAIIICNHISMYKVEFLEGVHFINFFLSQIFAVITDGATKFPTVLPSNNTLREFQIIRLNSFAVMQGKRYVQIFNYDVLADLQSLINNNNLTYHTVYSAQQQQQQQQKQQIQQTGGQQQPQQQQQQQQQQQYQQQRNNNNNNNQYNNNNNNNYNNNNYNNNNNGGNYRQPQVSSSQGNSNQNNICDIDALSEGMGSYTICAVVKNKSDIKEWKNVTSSGRLFSVEFADDSPSTCNTIKATVFGDPYCASLHQQLEAGKTYMVSGSGGVRKNSQKFNNTKHQYELTLGRDTTITPVTDQSQVIKSAGVVKFQFTPINSLVSLGANMMVDVLGEVTSVSTPIDITTKATERAKSKVLPKWAITIRDNTNSGIEVSFWGDDVAKYLNQITVGMIVGIKNAKLTQFNGHSLSFGYSSEIVLDPRHLDQYEGFRQWIAHNSGTNCASLTQRSTFTGNSTNKDAPVLTVAELLAIQTEPFDANNNPNQYVVHGTIRRGAFAKEISRDNGPTVSTCWYEGCAGCFKKVCGGLPKCEAPRMTNIWKLPIKIADDTGTLSNVDLFQSIALPILGPISDYEHLDSTAFIAKLDKELGFEAKVVVKYSQTTGNAPAGGDGTTTYHRYSVHQLERTTGAHLQNIARDLAFALTSVVIPDEQ